MMTSPKKDEKDAKPLTTHQDDDAPKAAKPAETQRELTDDEIAAVAGGAGGGWNVQANKTV
jgi:hypothetical protein